jgi:hypothetical protein
MFPNGPLSNRTTKRSGPTSDRIKAWHASRTPEERSITAKKAALKMTPEQLSERGRKNALAASREVLSERAKRLRASQTPERRREIAMLAVEARLAKGSKRTPEQKARMSQAQKDRWAKLDVIKRHAITEKGLTIMNSKN